MAKISLPILWWMDAHDLKKIDDDGDKLVEIVGLVKEFEGNRMSLTDLQDAVQEVIDRPPPEPNS